ncbi:DinB family protein [Planosporangium sp. 12N6]|uniref:DinB family protein n=1 Tax=Planosporangium spinosum TaxID=3402278 RepID=UPI003CE8FC9D
MTVSRPDPPLAPDELVSTGSEREVLEAFLDLYRTVVRRKLTGVNDDRVRQRLVPSSTTLAGIAKHLAAVEREWFQETLAQRPSDRSGVPSGGSEWRVGSDETIAGLLADYEDACAQSRRTAARFGLDDRVPHPRLGQVSLRWIYVHMIEETARHAGHADILREQTDGAVGFDG